MIKNSAFLVSCLLLTFKSFSQENSNNIVSKKDTISTPKQVATYVADRFTIIRPLNIEFSNASPYNYSPKKGHSLLNDGKVKDFKQVKVTANINFIKKKNYVFSATLGYKFTNVNSNLFESFTNNPKPVENNFHHHFTSLNFVYFSSLFGKRSVYTSSLIVDGSDQHFERIKGLVSAVIVLKADAKTVMSLGIVGNIDPTSQVPVLPIFAYNYKFENGLFFDAVLPKSVYLRKTFFGNARISLGTELDQTSFYLYNLEETKQRYEYRQVDVNSGLVYEYAIKDFIITGKAGLRTTPYARIFKKEEAFNKPVVELKPDATFYFNVGVSFNPFTLLKKAN